MTKIIFMGTPDFSVPILKELHKEYGVDLVISQPARPVGRKKVMTDPPVATAAKLLGIETYQPETMKSDEAFEIVSDLNPDLIITAAFGQLLPENILNIPALGSLNVHASLLPKHRGGAPIHRALINGDDETGVTIMYMAKKLDAGDIIAARSINIEDSDNTGRLFDKLSGVGASLLMDTLPSVIDGTNERTPQNDSEATFSPNILKSDEVISFNKPAREVFNHIRGLAPWPVGHAMLGDKRLKIFAAELADSTVQKEPGTITGKSENGFLVASADGLVNITEVQLAGKKKNNALDFINNNSDLIGTKLGED
ncbi:methionyl-tRNA formyltransferase [Jeotgalicoccus coquinae]|uniref:Methionyl-tRNA formyltransferase n=1 Tax=Jeotgalicoccus coquinae TaxID=709509 RepID=A0A6V7RJF4_9STAP|nr:methionyl-tRNA formyltransferase [Jeotgalicoccus coquinae]MBB6422560.1 methionyl-tRNA formyltransferase [Jeotgalicoccus coquinae]GGE14916.1 methionyl-tRNA formyltransferase [Jeotgalicoccus coquinae]CAD2078079.1 Methionyl-tRNA formyltransferase [Jeotgalicoccus coquinae]